MTLLALFGYATQVAVIGAYTLEAKSRWFVMAFAAGCALAGVYAYFIQAWPFFFSEFFWIAGAIYKFRSMSRDLPVRL